MRSNRICFRVKGMRSARSLLSVCAAGVLMVTPLCTGSTRASSWDYELIWVENFLYGAARVDWSADGE